MSDEPDPWPTPDKREPWTAAEPVNAMLCANCGKTIYWRRPNTKLRIQGGWKHEATGFAGCGFGATSVATPREEPTP